MTKYIPHIACNAVAVQNHKIATFVENNHILHNNSHFTQIVDCISQVQPFIPAIKVIIKIMRQI